MVYEWLIGRFRRFEIEDRGKGKPLRGGAQIAVPFIKCYPPPMGEISWAKAFGPPLFACLVMCGLAVGLAGASGIEGRGLLPAYLFPAMAVSLVCLLLWSGHQTIKMMIADRERPTQILIRAIGSRTERLLLTAIISPIFFAAFTTSKAAMARLTGFRWDGVFADIDAAIFGTDPWILTHALLGHAPTAWLAFFYTVIFGFTLAFASAFVGIYASRRFMGTYFLAMFITWLVGGIGAAYLFSSAGPVFAHLSDPALAPRFAPLVASLAEILSPDSSVHMTQNYLETAVDSPVVVRGGGISAMPSMHIAAATIYLLAARRTPWMWAAIPFLILTWVGSVHFGYHYAIDGALAVPIATFSWYLANAIYRFRQPENPEFSVGAI